MNITIQKATLDDTNRIAPLFDAYRQFYEQPADLVTATSYIHERLTKEESVIYLAMDGETALGFAQLYPTFCSVSAKNVWVLYDLFVTADARRKGVAKALMQAAKDLGLQTGAAWLKLETAHTNIPGQTLYESLGWEKEDEFYTYFLSLDD